MNSSSKKQQFSSPTYSSNQKSLPPVNMRERIVRLTETVNDLKVNVETEAQNQDNLEKVSSKNYTLMNTQIKALRKAFNTLADVIMEELDSIKGDVFRDFQDSNAGIYRKLDELGAQVANLQGEKQHQKQQAATVEHDLRERIKVLERQGTENNSYIQTVAETSKDGHKALYDKLSTQIRENSSKIANLAEENERLSGLVEDLTRKSNQDTQTINDLYNKIADLEDGLKQCNQELTTRIEQTKNQTGTLKETVKNEISVVIKGQTEFTRRLEEISTRLNERAEANEVAAQKRNTEIEDLINQVQQEFQENVQELARIHKESSTQIIVDFEKAITSINNDNKVLYKKFAVLEGAVGKTREELGNMISDHEHSVSRKNEQFNRAIFDMCRQLNISNPLLSY